MRNNLSTYAALTGACALSTSPPRPVLASMLSSSHGRSGQHTTPSMLQVFDDSRNTFVDALSNDLYHDLKSSSTRFVMPKDGDGNLRGSKLPMTMSARTAKADLRGGIAKGESLLLTWNIDDGDEHDYPSNDDDVIAMYCPANEANPRNFRDAATIAQARASTTKHLELHNKYRPDENDGLHRNDETIAALTQRKLACKVDDSWWISSFPIVREPNCDFRYWQRHDNVLQLAGRTGPLALSLSLENPTSIHIALTSIPSEMTVQFTTGAIGKPVVEYGPSNGNSKLSDFPMRADGTSTTYAASDMCQEPANVTEAGKFIDPGQLHTVILTNLEPDMEYLYRVGLSYGQGIVWSSTLAFHSALPAGWREPYSFIAYGDQGCPDDGWALGGNLTASMVRRELDANKTIATRLVHHFGDISYARGSGYLWDSWLDMVEPFASRIPLMVGVGNHEYDHTLGGMGKDPSGVTTDGGFHPAWGNFRTDSGGECGVPTAKRFLMPKTQRGNYPSNGVFWHSYSFGLVHTIMISSEHDLSKGSPQHAWLHHELASVNRTATPWVVVESHRPMYHSKPYWADNAVGIAMRAEFEDLLRKHRVDIFFAGHYHSYLRTCDGLYASKCHSGGPIHVTAGTAGAPHDDTSIGLYDNAWTEKYLGVWGYIRATVFNHSTMLLEFINAGNGTVEDSVRLHRDR